jgi:hypothetical protein
MLHKKLLLVIPEDFLATFSPLIDAWKGQEISVEIHHYPEDQLPKEGFLTKISKGFDAVMLAGAARYAPRTVISKPFIVVDKKRLPVGWLPVRNQDSLLKFIAAASEVQSRKRHRITLGLLSQRQPRYMQVANKMEGELKELSRKLSLFRWTSELVYPEDMLAGINCGMGGVIYLGHGRPVGWAGYYGIRIQHMKDFADRPAGAILSLCCNTANRHNVGFSFSENLVMEGLAASSFGAVRATQHTDNTRWAVNVCHSLTKGINTVGDLIVDAVPLTKSATNSYRLMGDPLAPLFSDKEAFTIAKKIKVYY